MAVGKLAALFEANCTGRKPAARGTWFFVHDFWGRKGSREDGFGRGFGGHGAIAYFASIRCDLARSQGAPTYKQYASGSSVLPKNVNLKFTVASTNVPAPYKIVWHVDNHGDEASEHNLLTWETNPSDSFEHWTSTAFKGSHRMICRIMKDDRVWAETSHIVKIAPGRWWKR